MATMESEAERRLSPCLGLNPTVCKRPRNHLGKSFPSLSKPDLSRRRHRGGFLPLRSFVGWHEYRHQRAQACRRVFERIRFTRTVLPSALLAIDRPARFQPRRSCSSRPLVRGSGLCCDAKVPATRRPVAEQLFWRTRRASPLERILRQPGLHKLE